MRTIPLLVATISLCASGCGGATTETTAPLLTPVAPTIEPTAQPDISEQPSVTVPKLADWQTHSGDGWVVMLPSDVKRLDNEGMFQSIGGPDMLLYANFGSSLFPIVDGWFDMLQKGITVRAVGDANVADAFERELVERRDCCEMTVEVHDTPQSSTESRVLTSRRIKPTDRHRYQWNAVKFVGPPGAVREITVFLVGSADGAAKMISECGVTKLALAITAAASTTASGIHTEGIEQALADYNPSFAAATWSANMANNKSSSGDYEAAIPDLRRVLSMCDAMGSAHNGLAWALLNKSSPEPDEALAHAIRAVELGAVDMPDILDTLIRAAKATGDTAREADALKRYQAAAGKPWVSKEVWPEGG